MELVVKRFDGLTLAELYEILKIRVAVFVVEQACPYPEADDKDQAAWHVFLRENGEIKAYLRVLAPGASFKEASIGRVLTVERSRGLGGHILREGLRIARERLHADKIRIEAQTYARGFYEKAGFRQVSQEFLEDGIPHIQMLLE